MISAGAVRVHSVAANSHETRLFLLMWKKYPRVNSQRIHQEILRSVLFLILDSFCKFQDDLVYKLERIDKIDSKSGNPQTSISGEKSNFSVWILKILYQFKNNDLYTLWKFQPIWIAGLVSVRIFAISEFRLKYERWPPFSPLKKFWVQLHFQTFYSD